MRRSALALSVMAAGFGVTVFASCQPPAKVQPEVEPWRIEPDTPEPAAVSAKKASATDRVPDDVPTTKTSALGQLPAQPPKADPTIEPATLEPGDVLSTKTIALDMKAVLFFSIAPDGERFGVFGKDRRKAELNDPSASFYFDTATGRRVGQPLENIGPGQLFGRGQFALYVDGVLGKDRGVVVRELDTGQETVVAPGKNGLGSLVLTADGKILVTAQRSTLGFLGVPDGKAAFPAVNTPDPITHLSNVFLNDTRIATLHDNGVVRVWDLMTGKEVDAVDLKSAKTGWDRLGVAGDGVAMIVRNSKNGEQMIWDLKAKKPMTWEQKSKFALFKPSYYPMSGGRVYFMGREYNVKLKGGGVSHIYFVALTDLATGTVTGRLLAPEDPEPWADVWVSRDGKRGFLLNTYKARVYVWDLPAIMK
jgi:hypothetical protein